MITYNSNKKINQLVEQASFNEDLKIPVYDELEGTKFLDASKLGNCLLKFSADGTNWVNTWTPSTTDIKISADGGTTWQTLLVGVNGINPGIWVIFTDSTVLPEVPALPQRITIGDGKQWQWTDPTGTWYDENDGTKNTIFQGISVYTGAGWTPWKVNRIRGLDGVVTKTVNVFKVSQEKPVQIPSNIGTFEDPIPAAELNALGWYDEPQDAGSTNIWMSQRTYYVDNALTNWTIPLLIEGGSGIYAVWSDNETLPAAPTSLPVRTNYSSTWTPDPLQLDHTSAPLWYDNPDGHTSKWMALSFLGVNGWGPWQIMQVLGEGTQGPAGQDGTSFQVDYKVPDEAALAGLTLQPGETVLVWNSGVIYIMTSNQLSSPYPIGRGPSGINVILTNETHAVPADVDGVVDLNAIGELSLAQTSVLVYAGTVELTPVESLPADNQYSISIQSATRCTAVKKVDNMTVYINTMDTAGVDAEVVIKVSVKTPETALAIDILKTFTITKAKRGIQGASPENAAKFVEIVASSQVFSYDKLGSLKPGSLGTITLKANPTNLTAPVTYAWEYQSILTGGTAEWVQLVSGANDTITVDHNNFTTQRVYRVTATDNDSYECSDQITLLKTYDGLDGDDGTPIMVKYGTQNIQDPNHLNWHSIFQTGDKYMIQSTDGGTAWSLPIKIVGEDGATGQTGNYTSYVFARSTIIPTRPSGTNPTAVPNSIWRDEPYEGTGALWMSSAVKTSTGLLVSSAWSTPVRVTGDKGDTGDNIVGSRWEMGNFIGIRGDGSEVVLIPANEIFNNYVRTNGSPNVNTLIFDIEEGIGGVIGVDEVSMAGKFGLCLVQGNSRNISHIGHYNGVRFTTYLDFNGNFYCGNQEGNKALQWNSAEGVLQIGDINTGRGIKWDQASAQLTIVGKYLSVNDANTTRIEIDPGIGGNPYFKLHHTNGYGVEILASKIYQNDDGSYPTWARGGTVITRTLEAMQSVNASYMVEVGRPASTFSTLQTKLFAGGLEIHAHAGYTDLFQWNPARTLLKLNYDQLVAKNTYYFKTEVGPLIFAPEEGAGDINLHTATLRINNEPGLDIQIVGVDTVMGPRTLRFSRGILVEVLSY